MYNINLMCCLNLDFLENKYKIAINVRNYMWSLKDLGKPALSEPLKSQSQSQFIFLTQYMVESQLTCPH